MEKLLTLVELVEQYKNLNNLIFNALRRELDKLFDKYPEIKTYNVPAYSDYFNDGDACPFYVRIESSWCETDSENIYLDIERYDYDEDTDEEEAVNEDIDKKIAIVAEFADLASLVPSAVINEVIDDGVLIFSKGSFKTDWYDHD